MPVNGDSAFGDVVEPRQHVHNRGLTTAGRAEECNDLTGLRIDADVREHRRGGPVREGDVVEHHVALCVLELMRVRRVPHLGLRIDHLEHALGARDATSRRVHEHANGAQRQLQRVEPQCECEQLRRGDLASGDQQCADTGGEANLRHAQALQQRLVLCHLARLLQVQISLCLDDFAELLALEVLAAERLHDADARERLVGGLRDDREALLDRRPERAHSRLEHDGTPHDDRHRRHAHQREQRVDLKHEDQADHDQHRDVDDAEHRLREEHADVLHVLRRPRHDLAVLDLIVVRVAHALDVVVHIVADVVRDLLAQRLAEVRLTELRQTSPQRGDDYRERGVDQQRLVAIEARELASRSVRKHLVRRLESVLERIAHELWTHLHQCSRDEHRKPRERDGPAIALHVWEESKKITHVGKTIRHTDLNVQSC